MTVVAISNQKGGVGKTTTATNLGVLLAGHDRRVLVVDADPQFALTRQIVVDERSLGVNLADVLAGRAAAADAIVRDVHGVDVIAAAPALAGIEMSLVSELGRERFLRDALERVLDEYDDAVIDTPPNLGLLDRQRACRGRTGRRAGQRRGRRVAARDSRAASDPPAARRAPWLPGPRVGCCVDAMAAAADQ